MWCCNDVTGVAVPSLCLACGIFRIPVAHTRRGVDTQGRIAHGDFERASSRRSVAFRGNLTDCLLMDSIKTPDMTICFSWYSLASSVSVRISCHLTSPMPCQGRLLCLQRCGHVKILAPPFITPPPPLVSVQSPQPPVSEHRDPAPSAASLAESSYNYPDPSPANSPSSVILNSSATAMSEAPVPTATRDGATAGKPGRVSNGEAAELGKNASTSVGTGGGLSLGDAASRATAGTAAGVQTTPSVNGTAEMDRLK